MRPAETPEVQTETYGSQLWQNEPFWQGERAEHREPCRLPVRVPQAPSRGRHAQVLGQYEPIQRVRVHPGNREGPGSHLDMR